MKKTYRQVQGSFWMVEQICFLAIFLSSSLVSLNSYGGTVVAWGSNFKGATTVPEGLTNVMAVSAGRGASLALKADGTIVGWGNSEMGLVDAPVGLTNVIAISLGMSNSMALRPDGNLVVWGYNNFGPVFVPPGLSNIVAMAGTFCESLVLREDGTLLAWGRTAYEELSGLTVVQTNLVATSQSFSMGGWHGLALRRDGTVCAWGDNSAGQCDIPAELTHAIAVTAGNNYSLALKADGTVVGWGVGYAPPTFELTNVVAISSSGGYHIALKADGTLATWGNISVEPPPNLTNVIQVSMGMFHTLALVGDGPPVRSVPLTVLQKTGDNLSLSLPTQSGRTYGLEYSDSLNDTNWVPLPLRPGNGASQVLDDATATNASRFYRVIRW